MIYKIKLSIIILSFILINNVKAVPSTINSPVSGSGWSFSQHNPGGSYAGIGGANDGYSWDINYGSGWSDDGLPVYAVEDGCIYTGSYWNGSTYGQLLIEHTTESGQEWSSGYLHMKNIVKTSGCVSRGDKIGEVYCTGLTCVSPQTPHLHFAVYDSHGKYGLNSVDVNFNTVTYPLIENKSYFDGVGSLIRPEQNCWGCQHDEAIMHSHEIPSTVVFQWLSNASCPYIKIGLAAEGTGEISNSSLSVVINSKLWNSHYTGDAFKASLPLTVKNQGSWNTTAITSQKPLSSSKRIIAECTSSPMSFGKTKIKKDLVELSSGYFWAGNASIISGDATPVEFGTGVNEDWAITFNSHKAITAFQWQSSSNCSSLKIESDWNGEDGEVEVNYVAIKNWNLSTWEDAYCHGKLPCTISVIGDAYRIIQIYTGYSGVPSGYIHATCQ